MIRRDNRTPPPVARRHRQPRLTGMVGLAANPVKKKRPAGARLAVVIGIGQAHEQTPPIVDQRDQSRHVLAALQVPRGEAAHAPLVLQLVEAVLRVRPVPVELGDRANLKIKRRRQNRELPDPRARLRVGPERIALAVIAARQRRRPRQETGAAPQRDASGSSRAGEARPRYPTSPGPRPPTRPASSGSRQAGARPSSGAA